MREIKTILELLIGKLMGDHKSVSTLRKYLKKGFSKIAQDELSIDKSNRTQINLIKAVLGMHNAYDKLDNFAKYSNFTRKELISELKKLKAFEGNLKHAVVHMMIHSHRMDAKMKQIKSAIEEKPVSHIICTLFDACKCDYQFNFNCISNKTQHINKTWNKQTKSCWFINK
jgi:hypothetical protein